jgi:hypothetical protein
MVLGQRVAAKTSLGTLLLTPLLLVAVPTRAQGPAPTPPPPTESRTPSPIPRLAPAIVERLSKTTTAWVYEVDTLAAPGCQPRASMVEDRSCVIPCDPRLPRPENFGFRT